MTPPSHQHETARVAIDAAFTVDETQCVEGLLAGVELDPTARARIQRTARALVLAVRARQPEGLDIFLHEYDLSTEEGVALMCLAEALLRIPDSITADRFIQDKIGKSDWEQHLGQSASFWVNASTWGLMLTGSVIQIDPANARDMSSLWQRLAARVGEPVVRLALKQAMRIVGSQFVMGQTIEEALTRSRNEAHSYECFSFDMLGEAALNAHDAQRYTQSYAHAIEVLGRNAHAQTAAYGISIKLSALHPRFEFSQRARVLAELVPRLLTLARQAQAAHLQLTIDAEEADRLDLMLDVFSAVFCDPTLRDWSGFGLAVQAYQKRALTVLEWLAELAHKQRKCIPIRLVKGAYWDSEIKRAQERGLEDYPVFTRKAATDTSYIVCARFMLAAHEAFHCQFATHNAHTIAAIIEFAGNEKTFEFQRLHGMGTVLYEAVASRGTSVVCRVYAPVGSHADLLPYLVRRLLENGANTSFVNRILDKDALVDHVVADPIDLLHQASPKRHPRVPRPVNLYGAWRNSQGINLQHAPSLTALMEGTQSAIKHQRTAAPLVAGKMLGGTERKVIDPADQNRILGHVVEAEDAAVEQALRTTVTAQETWGRTSARQRAEILERAADLIEQRQLNLFALLMREGGKCIPDALAEIREAADYCRYYAYRTRRDFDEPRLLPGPTGERNTLGWCGRGVFACISPWNFPLAIFTGQITAALAAGNVVIAKPARQTPLVAMYATKLLHEAGVPVDALQLLPGSGARIGEVLLKDARIHGVAITGSTDTARVITRQLAARDGPIVPFIAETGGQNAMIVDSSALPEQVVRDVLTSAFNSAGQRCSALRVLFLQDDIAPRVLDLLTGAMAELKLGDPSSLATDIGPVIDAAAVETLMQHARQMNQMGQLIYELPLPNDCAEGSFFAPRVFEIERLSVLQREVFGPILHVIRYTADRLDAVLAAINQTGYGLTLGIHTRVEATARYIIERVRVGNIYVNRSQIGAVVGVQPFGGEGLSGTGPKAGGPNYLARFAVERTVSINTAAVGGDRELLSLDGQ